MSKKEDVLLTLFFKGEVYINGVAIKLFRYSSGSMLHAENIFMWEVQANGKKSQNYCFEDLSEAVDQFLIEVKLRTKVLEFPDANELLEENRQADEAEYIQWCADNYIQLLNIGESILQANAAGRRTMYFDVPPTESVSNYKRYFEEKHYHVTIQQYSKEHIDKPSWPVITLSWSPYDPNRRRR